VSWCRSRPAGSSTPAKKTGLERKQKQRHKSFKRISPKVSRIIRTSDKSLVKTPLLYGNMRHEKEIDTNRLPKVGEKEGKGGE
jgi:hypothetical protein